MFAGDHEALFGAGAAAGRPSLESVDFETLMARGRRERARQFGRWLDAAAGAVKRLFGMNGGR